MPSEFFSTVWIYLGSFNDTYIKSHHEEITALSTFVIAIYTVILACIARRQTKDSRILNRAWLGVEPCGVSTYIPREKTDAPQDQILGHFGVHNAGHLPARNVKWGFNSKFSDEEVWEENSLENLNWFGGDNVIPPGITMRQGAVALSIPSRNRSRYLYVWGRVEYEDGFGKPRWTNFCHRYNLKRLKPRTVKGQRIKSEYGRYYERGNQST